MNKIIKSEKIMLIKKTKGAFSFTFFGIIFADAIIKMINRGTNNKI